MTFKHKTRRGKNANPTGINFQINLKPNKISDRFCKVELNKSKKCVPNVRILIKARRWNVLTQACRENLFILKPSTLNLYLLESLEVTEEKKSRPGKFGEKFQNLQVEQKLESLDSTKQQSGVWMKIDFKWRRWK